MKNNNKYAYHFTQNGGLIQAQISTIDDVLNLRDLPPEMWTALACPVNGLEFSSETLSVLDKDHNGRVRIPEILAAVDFIKKYFTEPEIIMSEGDSIPLKALSEVPFDCGHTPLDSAKSILHILGKDDASEISINDVSVNEKLFAPNVVNGDGVLPPECVKDEKLASIVTDIVNCTGGTDDISGAKGITRAQAEEFFNLAKSLKEWRTKALEDDPKIFFLKDATDSAAISFMKVQDKINDYFLRCSLINFDAGAAEILKTKTDTMFLDENGELYGIDELAKLPIAFCQGGKPLPLDETVNPAWAGAIKSFKENVVIKLMGKEVSSISENVWRKIEDKFKAYTAWYKEMPENAVSSLGLDRIEEILSGNYENQIYDLLTEEEKHPPIALASVELKKMLLLRRDFVELLKNFVSFENFYNLEKKAIFQAGTLFIDGRSCDLCFKVLDIAKHGVMAALSQCYLVYCDCTKKGNSDEKMQIAALISNGNTDNLIVGRNGVFFDRQGNDWDATIVKIVENPVSIKQAFWAPYRKLARLIQEKMAKAASNAENKVSEKMNKVVADPKASATNAATAKKTDIGTVAAISVAFTGIATVITAIMNLIFDAQHPWKTPLIVLGIILAISLPSMIIAWSKLRQRNIAPVLDASGWAINGNAKISMLLGNSLTNIPNKPASAYLNKKDKYADKKFPWKRVIGAVLIIALVILLVHQIIINPDGIQGVWNNIKSLGSKFHFGS